MKFFHDLFVSEGILPCLEQIVEKIKQNTLTPNIYVITFASNPKNLLDIIPTWELMQPGYPKKDVEIIGIAGGKKDALELVEHMIRETFEQTGNIDVRAYLTSKQEGQT